MRLLKVRAAQLIEMLLNGMLAECNDQITGALQIIFSRQDKTMCLFGIDNKKCHIIRKHLNEMCLYVIIIVIL